MHVYIKKINFKFTHSFTFFNSLLSFYFYILKLILNKNVSYFPSLCVYFYKIKISKHIRRQKLLLHQNITKQKLKITKYLYKKNKN